MNVIPSIPKTQELIQKFRQQGKSIGFVPTMGYLHEGHASLLRQCRKNNDIVVLSIFVNPLQFGKNEDLAKYPRDFKKDELLAKKENVDIIFYPSEGTMFPDGYKTEVRVRELTDALCGRFRPGHFDGVATVVAKLLNIVLPDRMYLGQKDAQQAVILKRMVADLNFPLEVKVLPTVREKDGLAMSSRNSYLTSQERNSAAVLYQALSQAQRTIRAGEKSPKKITEMIRSMVRAKADGPIDYVECVDAETLQPLNEIRGSILIALAVWFGKARLIDNVQVRT